MARKARPLGDNVRGYLAGMFDLKGNAYTTRDGRFTAYIMGISDPQMQRDIVRWTGGGSTTESSSEGDRRGCTVHCDQPHVHYTRTTFRYTITGYRALCVVYTLEPSLFRWREKFANPVAEALARKPIVGFTEKLATEMADKGWELP